MDCIRDPHTRKRLGRGHRLDRAYGLRSRNVSLPYIAPPAADSIGYICFQKPHPSRSVGMSERLIRVPFCIPRKSSSSIQSHSGQIGCCWSYLAATGSPVHVAHFRQTSRKLDAFLFLPPICSLTCSKIEERKKKNKKRMDGTEQVTVL